MPWLLRPREQANVFTFVGECYVEGLTEGGIRTDPCPYEGRVFTFDLTIGLDAYVSGLYVDCSP